jgi:hypothetical protein
MHIEVWKGAGKQPWRWHSVSKGRVTSSSEAFPSKAHALRAAKGLVRAVLRPICGRSPVAWTQTEREGKTVLRWA